MFIVLFYGCCFQINFIELENKNKKLKDEILSLKSK